MNEKTRKLARRIEKLKREFSMLPSLEERHSSLEIEEYQHFLLELEENVIVFKYLIENFGVQAEVGNPLSAEEPVESVSEKEQKIEPLDKDHKSSNAENSEEIEDSSLLPENELREEDTEPIKEIAENDAPEAIENKELISTGESFNDKIQTEDNSLATKLAKSPISDLRKAFGLNERFFYTNELFGGDGQEFVRALNELNHLESFDDAQRLIEARYEKNFNWKKDDETVQSFIEVVERRYL